MQTHKKSSSLVDRQSLLVVINQSATPSSLLSGANVLTRLICQRLVLVRSILTLYSISYLADCINLLQIKTIRKVAIKCF